MTLEDHAPFMEHPTGEFDAAVLAIESAVERLLQMGMGDRWIVFSGQGQGGRPDSYHCEDVSFLGNTFDVGREQVDLQDILTCAGLMGEGVVARQTPDGKVTLPEATPSQLAHFLDALFREHFGIRPFDGEDDYAVGAEWA